jgi:acyl-coenzyme A thioesterase PaaI-like protein
MTDDATKQPNAAHELDEATRHDHRQGQASFAHSTPIELDRLGVAVGELLDELLRVDDREVEFSQDFEEALDRIHAATEILRRHARDRNQIRVDAPTDETRDARPYYVGGAIVGPHAPVFPRIVFEFAEGRSTGTVNFPLRFEGPPQSLHGGVVALFFDQVLGQHNLMVGVPAMTGSLTVRYRKPTPLFRDLDFEVESERHGERKIITRGRLFCGEEVFAEGEGLFILPRPWMDDQKLG